MKYSTNFERDFKWYLLMRHKFSFDGKGEYFFKRQGYVEPMFVEDKNGMDGKKAFYCIDTYGKPVKTKHPNLLLSLLKTKGSVNLHIKMYAEDRATGVLPRILFDELCEEIQAPQWFYAAVENQKISLIK